MPVVDVPAPMAGSIKEILVSVGEAVAAGQELLILESMKMEIPLESPVGASVAEILIAPAEHIDEGQVLLRLDA